MSTTALTLPAPGVPAALSELASRHPRAVRRLTAAHAMLLRITRGAFAARWFGMPVLVLETTGRRTGRVRRTPLVYLPDGNDLVVVASDAGSAKAPAWWLNLQAAGEGVAIVGGVRRPVTAGVTDGACRAALWRRFAAVSPVERYQRQTARRLPVVTLTPAPDARPARASRAEVLARASRAGWVGISSVA